MHLFFDEQISENKGQQHATSITGKEKQTVNPNLAALCVCVCVCGGGGGVILPSSLVGSPFITQKRLKLLPHQSLDIGQNAK